MATKREVHAATSRSRDPPLGDEEASSELKLGEFQDTPTLTHSEAALLINALTKKRRDAQQVTNESEIYGKTNEYLEHFARFKQRENVEAVERLLSAHRELHSFERSQLGSLCCDTAEEAKTLIPSLTDKISDDDLQDLLNEITKLMGYPS